MNDRFRRTAQLTVPGLLLTTCAALAAPPAPMAGSAKVSEPKVLVYAISRNGSQIGKHSVTITTGPGSATSVESVTDIVVKVVFVTAYAFHSVSHENWNGDKFTSYTSQTDDNGKKHTVNATVDPKGAVNVTADGKKTPMPAGVIPATFWNAQLMDRTNLFDGDTGLPLEIKVTEVGHDQIPVRGVKKDATHYKISGAIERDAWFADGIPVRFQLKGSDNSTIVSDLMPDGTPALPATNASVTPGTGALPKSSY